MHHTTPFALVSVAMASRSVILEAPDDACGYLNGMGKAPFGCHNTSEKCAIYYPTSTMAATTTMLSIITPAPQPSVICYEPSRGDCTVQPTACVDAFGDCTGICSNDPMTLKCTAGRQIYCNRAHFESPLSFRNIEAMDIGLRPTDAPADGWFCGPSAIPFQQVDKSHGKTASTAHMSHSLVSPTTTLGVTITLTKPGLGPGPSVSPSTTLSVTITLSKPGRLPDPSPIPSPPAAVVSEDIESEDDPPSLDDCCYDEQDTAGPCCNEARQARPQQRQAIRGPTTVASPQAASEDVINRGSAIVCTTYTGQTNRPPFVQATRPWNVVIPTAVETSTTETGGPRTRPRPPKGKKNRLNIRGIIIGAILGGSGIIATIYCFLRKRGYRLFSRRQRHLAQHQNGNPVHVSKRQENCVRFLKNLESMTNDVADVGSLQVSPDYGVTREQSGPFSVGHVSPEPGQSTEDGDEETLEPQSEESLEQEAYAKAVGNVGSDRRNRAYNVL